MKGLVLNTKTNGFGFTDDSTLQGWHDIIGCRCIDIVQRRIGGKVFEIVIDDEGLLTDEPIISALDYDGHPMLVGSLVIYGGVDSEGGLTEITENDVKTVVKHLAHYIDKSGFPRLSILCEYV